MGRGGEAQTGATELREQFGVAVDVPVDCHIRGTVKQEAAAKGGTETATQPLPRVTMADVAKHSTRGDLWIVVRGVAYDLSGWEESHPGGVLPLLSLAGRDATDPFEAYHPSKAWQWLRRFEVAVVTDAIAAPGSTVHDGSAAPNAFELAAAAAAPPSAAAMERPTADGAKQALHDGTSVNGTDVNGNHASVAPGSNNFGVAGSYKVTVAFRALRQRLLAEGMYETRPSFYVGLAVWYSFLFAATLYSVLALQSALLGALFLGAFFQQMAFLGHDLGHNAVTHCRRTDGLIGHFAGNLLTGISVAWWKRSHNVHHVVTNSIDYDPDIQHLSIMTVVADILAKTGDPDHAQGAFFSTYHEKEFDVNHPAIRFVIGVQHYLYYPIMALARWNLYAQSWILLLSRPKEVEGWWKEFAGNAGFIMWLTALTMQFPAGTGERPLFLLLSHAVAGLTLHVQITMSHFSADTYMGRPYNKNDDADGWVHTQLAGSIDIDCPEWLDWFHGGLQFQIEHHLFPRVPRHNLRALQGVLKAFCAEHGLTHISMPFSDCNVHTVKHMARVGKALAEAPPANDAATKKKA